MLTIEPKKSSSYFMPTKVFFGRSALKKIIQIIDPYKPKKILFVCGEHFKNSTQFKDLKQKLKKKVEFACFNIPIEKSNFSIINYLSAYLRRNSFDTLIAAGGGTIIDVSKSAAILVNNSGSVESYLKGKKSLSKKGVNFFAVPTTAGTGSEVTPWATIWGEDRKKYSLSSIKYMFPKVAIVDPSTTDFLPAKITAESGIDALCQAIESYWNTNHNKISDQYALKSIDLIYSNLEKAVLSGAKKYRDKMMWGSLLGGLAFSNTQTTICHAISYPITINWKIAHGQAVCITLALFIKIILPLLSKSRQIKLLKVLDSNTPKQASLKVETLIEKIGMNTRLSQLSINREDLSLIAKDSINQKRLSNSPFIPSVSGLEELLLTIL